MKLAIRSIHKYLSLFISLQLLLWTISGIYFAYNKIEMIRGEHLRTLQNKDVPINLAEFPTITGNSIMGIIRLDQVIFKINTSDETFYLDAKGKTIKPINSSQAMEIINTNTSLQSISANKILTIPRGAEYRGRNLPLWQVETDHPNKVNAYVDGMTGEVVSIRSSSWRLWDFLWGLHIMDYVDRDNINNLLMKVFSILALISSLSGIALFFNTRKKSIF